MTVTRLLAVGMLAAFALATSAGSLSAEGSRVPFVPNAGQWQTEDEFVASSGALSVRLDADGIWLQLERRDEADRVGHVVRLSFPDRADSVQLEGAELLAGHMAFFLGSESEGRWQSSVARYGSVEYSGLYPGVDLSVAARPGGVALKFLVEDQVALARVRLGLEGDAGSSLDHSRIGVRTSLGEIDVDLSVVLRDSGSVAREVQLVPLAAAWSLTAGSAAVPEGFTAAAGSVTHGLEWSTYLGAANGDRIEDVAVDSRGVITVCGQTGSPTFPTTPGPFTSYGGWDWDAFVTRIDPSIPALSYSVLLGGVFDDFASDLVLGPGGRTYVCGATASANFPTTASAYQPNLNGSGDAVVLCLNGSGTGLAYSTFLGGPNGGEGAVEIALEPGGEVTVVGSAAPGFPSTPGVLDEVPKNLFITRLDPTGSSLVYSTFLGEPAGVGVVLERMTGIASYGDGRVIVCGYTGSYVFPTTSGAFSEINSSAGPVYSLDMFVSILSSDASLLEASTYLGSSLNDRAYSVDVGLSGDVFVGGWAGPGFPTTAGAFQASPADLSDALICRLTPGLDDLVYSTFVGGDQFDSELIWSLRADPSGIATAVGWTDATDFPVTSGALSEFSPPFAVDAFALRISPAGDRLFYSTFLGGTGFEQRVNVVMDSHGSVVIAGMTEAQDFPLTPDFLFGPAGGGVQDTSDGFIARLSMLPTGVCKLGDSSESCRGQIFMGVTKMAEEGDAGFGVMCSGAPPNAAAALSLGFGEFPGGGLVLPEFTYYLDVFKPIVVLLDDSDSDGYAEFDLPLPPGTAGLEFFMQYIWVNTAECGGLGTLSASNALSIEIQ